MGERVAVVTGASAGVGKATARKLLEAGWRVIGLGRDPQRTATAEAELRALAGGRFSMILADLALVREAERAAAEISGQTEGVHVLVNNAGGVLDRRHMTEEGLEATFAGNHLGPFALTLALLPLLQAAAAGSVPGSVRVISVSSTGHEGAPGLRWNDLQMEQGFTPGGAYCNAKLANILFTGELARRFAADGIVAHAMHPGEVGSNFIAHAAPDMQAYMRTRDLRPPEEAAETVFWLAIADEPGRSTGGYFHKLAPATPSPASQDQTLAARL